MTDQQALLRRMAALTVVSEAVADSIAETKTELAEQIPRGTVYAFADPTDPTSQGLGEFRVTKPRQPAARIVDEEQAVAWLSVAGFDVDALTEVRLTEQGRKTVLQAAKDGRDPAGVQVPPVGAPTKSWRMDADQKLAVIGMWRRGELVVDTSLVLPEGDQE